MVKLKEEEINGEKFVNLGSRSYKFVEETRGIREKFWLVLAKSKYFKDPLHYRYILFKYNRNDVSCENWGEVYASRIAKQIGVPCVEYHLASYEKDGKEFAGVMCGTYKKNENEVEATAYDVQTMLDEKPKKINTIDNIVENLMLLVPSYKDREFYYTYIRNALIKQAVLDFLLAQTDRHWFNTTFLMYATDDVFNLRKAECYDNGCICFLKRKFAAIEGISREIKVQGKNSQRLHDLLKDYVPMMGIKTPTVKINTDKFKEEDKKLKVIKSTRDVFLDELVNEILNNDEIAIFYQHIKTNLNLSQINELLEREKTPPPKPVADMVESVIGYQFNLINTLIDEKIKQSKYDLEVE